MTAPAWAAQVGPGLPGELTQAILRAATAAATTPERLRAVLAARLERNASTDVRDVLAELVATPTASPPAAASDPAASQERGGAAVEAAGRALRDQEARVVAVGFPGYPSPLVPLWPDLGAPAWLFVRGAGIAATRCAVAVVGTRRPSADGLRTARELGRFLARAGVCVVSGLARGIDQAAHRGAIEGGGSTVAVLGTGFGVDYPRGDGRLRAAVAGAGALVSEYPPGTPPRPVHFLWRNRIISGLAQAVVVVEGRTRSGALQTARLAAAQGRDVFAVPGSLNAPASSGPLALVRDGAAVLTRFDDVLDVLDREHAGALAAVVDGAGTRFPDGLSAAARSVAGLLGPLPAPADVLADGCDLPVVTLLTALAELEAAGVAAHTPRGFVLALQGADPVR